MRRSSLLCPFVLISCWMPAVVAADTCSLLTNASAGAVLGQPVVESSAAAPSKDEDSDGELSYCTYRASAAGVVVSVITFTSKGKAQEQLTDNLVRQRLDTDDVKISEESGIGEKVFYGASAAGASYVFLVGNKVVGIGVGGDGLPGPEIVKEALRKAAKEVESKL
jgi:hypothetical protein